VTRKAKVQFDRARREYNEANDTDYAAPRRASLSESILKK